MNLPIKIISTVLGVLIVACSSVQADKNERLKAFVEAQGYNYNQFSSVLVITEKGCPQCNSSFARFMKQQEGDASMLYIVSANGTMVDISGLFDFKNVINDYKREFKTVDISDKSCCVLLTPEGAIDSIIELKAKSLENDLAYIQQQLKVAKPHNSKNNNKVD